MPTGDKMTKPKIGAIIQARMSSRRFPNKVLYEIEGKPLLGYLLDRLQQCNSIECVVAATSIDESDTPIAEYCKNHRIECYRGSLNDVAGRFKGAIEHYGFGSFVRVNGDSPLLDQLLIDHAVETFLKDDYDVVTNTLKRTYPKGQSVEVIRADAFNLAYKSMQKEDEFEHVTRFFYKYPENYRIYNFMYKDNLGDIQLSVDTEEDMDTFKAIISEMSQPHWEYHLEDILGIYRTLWDRKQS